MNNWFGLQRRLSFQEDVLINPTVLTTNEVAILHFFTSNVARPRASIGEKITGAAGTSICKPPSYNGDPCAIKVKGATSITGTTKCNAFELLDVVVSKVSKHL